MRVAVLGATGFIGRHLVRALHARGDDVVSISLRDAATAAARSRGSDAIVNLAGEPIAQRWNEDAKARMHFSRVEAPRQFLEEFRTDDGVPRAYISASAVGYYGTSETATFTEDSAPGNDFLAQLCVDWERVARSAETLGMRVTIVRTGLALADDGGALEKILPPFKVGAGGRVGSGKQWYSWVHIDDVINIYLMAIDGASGVFNATAPTPVTNNDFTKELARTVHRPAFLPAPMFAIKAMLGEGAYVVTEGQRVLPERTMAQGYRFKYPLLRQALESIVKA